MSAVTSHVHQKTSSAPPGAAAAAALSAQELAIEQGAKALHGNISERVLRIFDAIRGYGSPRVTVHRAVYFTESFKQTEGQPLVLRWAKALKHVAENIPVTIFEDELIVGRPNTWLGRYGLVYGELDGSLLKAAAEAADKQVGQKGAVAFTAEDKRAIEDVLYPYWNGKDFGTSFVRRLPEDTRFFFFGPDRNNASNATGVGIATAIWRHSQNWAHDFAK
ncbi:MAG TPA: pyruvate formate lyase family protein, partial [Burkholderiaceae bacterium]|nr:pyruvate formate lyase family protein [Burkholderiaceae bacterium]